MVDNRVDAPVSQRARHRELRFILLLGSGLLAGTLVVAVVSIANGPGMRPNGESGPPTVFGSPTSFAIVVTIPVVLAAAALAYEWWRRRRRASPVAVSSVWELPLRERVRLVRALRRGDPVPLERREFAQRVGRDVAARRKGLWLYPYLAVLSGWNAVLQDGMWQRWLFAAIAVVLLVAAVCWGWLIRRMRLAVTRLSSDAS
jgi:hypothetical protein